MRKLLLAALFFLASNTYAGDCAVNGLGFLECSIYPNGGAAIGNMDLVMCGKGKCVVAGNGIVMCSRTDGGGAGVDRNGTPKCQGGCEMGQRHYCEVTL